MLGIIEKLLRRRDGSFVCIDLGGYSKCVAQAIRFGLQAKIRKKGWCPYYEKGFNEAGVPGGAPKIYVFREKQQEVQDDTVGSDKNETG